MNVIPRSNHECVLVLDADTLPALAIVRSLGRKRVRVLGASHIATSLCAHSRHMLQCFRYPSPLLSVEAYVDWVRDFMGKNPNCLVIPVTERTLVPLANALGNTESAERIMMADPQALETVLDKSATSELAKSCDVPLPLSWDVASMDDLESVLPELSYPVVVKPGRSISTGEQRTPLTVCYAHSEEALRKYCAQFLQQVHIVLQEYFVGDGLGIELIADHGEVRYAFQHKRLHEMPLTGGGSSYRMSAEIDEDLLEAAKRLIKSLNWHGVAMVEFKKNPATDAFILIEINGRFWGSLPLATAAGADFPWLVYQLYRAGAVPACDAYRRGVRCRKLSADLAWMEAVARKDADERLVTIPTIRQALADFAEILKPSHYFDAQSWRDMTPGLVDIGRIVRAYCKRITGMFKERAVYKQLLAEHNPRHHLDGIRPGANILLLCYGNINRSAIAHCLLHNRLDGQADHIKSAGFHPIGDRCMDERMQAIAPEGLNVENFRSQVVDEALLDWADVVFVMEVSHIQHLTQRYPRRNDRIVLLGGMFGDSADIIDPYGKHQDVYQSVFQQVNANIDVLAKKLAH